MISHNALQGPETRGWDKVSDMTIRPAITSWVSLRYWLSEMPIAGSHQDIVYGPVAAISALQLHGVQAACCDCTPFIATGMVM